MTEIQKELENFIRNDLEKVSLPSWCHRKREKLLNMLNQHPVEPTDFYDEIPVQISCTKPKQPSVTAAPLTHPTSAQKPSATLPFPDGEEDAESYDSDWSDNENPYVNDGVNRDDGPNDLTGVSLHGLLSKKKEGMMGGWTKPMKCYLSENKLVCYNQDQMSKPCLVLPLAGFDVAAGAKGCFTLTKSGEKHTFKEANQESKPWLERINSVLERQVSGGSLQKASSQTESAQASSEEGSGNGVVNLPLPAEKQDGGMKQKLKGLVGIKGKGKEKEEMLKEDEDADAAGYLTIAHQNNKSVKRWCVLADGQLKVYNDMRHSAQELSLPLAGIRLETDQKKDRVLKLIDCGKIKATIETPSPGENGRWLNALEKAIKTAGNLISGQEYEDPIGSVGRAYPNRGRSLPAIPASSEEMYIEPMSLDEEEFGGSGPSAPGQDGLYINCEVREIKAMNAKEVDARLSELSKRSQHIRREQQLTRAKALTLRLGREKAEVEKQLKALDHELEAINKEQEELKLKKDEIQRKRGTLREAEASTAKPSEKTTSSVTQKRKSVAEITKSPNTVVSGKSGTKKIEFTVKKSADDDYDNIFPNKPIQPRNSGINPNEAPTMSLAERMKALQKFQT